MRRICLFFILTWSTIVACNTTIDVFEKTVRIPDQQWKENFTPQIDFTITDTNALYRIFMVIRHTDAYNFNNIWIKGTVQEPGKKTSRSQQYDLTLATNEKGWLGSGMDDIFEHRILLQDQTKFKTAGTYQFTLEQIMRQDPLQHVMNVGIRIEKQ